MNINYKSVNIVLFVIYFQKYDNKSTLNVIVHHGHNYR